jgi:hypothetical protein
MGGVEVTLGIRFRRVVSFTLLPFYPQYPLDMRLGEPQSRSGRCKEEKQSALRWWSECQPYAPAALYPQEDSWYSFLLEAESTPGP